MPSVRQQRPGWLMLEPIEPIEPIEPGEPGEPGEPIEPGCSLYRDGCST